MPKRKKATKKAEKSVDTFSAKRGRGRPGVRPSEIRGRADNYRFMLNQIWKDAGDLLLKAQTEEDVIRAFDPWPSCKQEFASISGLVMKVLRDPKFPKRRQPQINFLADSLAGRGLITPRRARDICEQERKKKEHYIIRQDYYIKCTCHYKGPALHGRCPKCGTGKLSLPLLPFISEPQTF